MDAKTFDAKSLLDTLFDKSILFKTGVDGLYGRSGVFEDVIERFERLVTSIGAPDKATRIHFPPGMSRATLEGSGYMKSFPQLAGCVHSFMGGEREHAQLLGMMAAGEDWTELQQATNVVLTPAACYPLYPTVAARGPVPDDGVLFELSSYCFRHEPSKDPAAHAAVPHARIRPHRDGRAGVRLPRKLAGARQGDDRVPRPAMRS
ncbi:hypothetical protein ACVMIH_005512 [Bradyrhizobium sp. USDA 4503]